MRAGVRALHLGSYPPTVLGGLEGHKPMLCLCPSLGWVPSSPVLHRSRTRGSKNAPAQHASWVLLSRVLAQLREGLQADPPVDAT